MDSRIDGSWSSGRKIGQEEAAVLTFVQQVVNSDHLLLLISSVRPRTAGKRKAHCSKSTKLHSVLHGEICTTPFEIDVVQLQYAFHCNIARETPITC